LNSHIGREKIAFHACSSIFAKWFESLDIATSDPKAEKDMASVGSQIIRKEVDIWS
jgi:hypothetical protein